MTLQFVRRAALIARRASIRSLAFGLLLLPVVLVGNTPAAQPNFPMRIDFPAGWSGEGIAVARGHIFYSSDTANGAIYRGDLRSGEGAILVPGQSGRNTLGVFVDNRNRVFIAGSRTGKADVYDGTTGALLAEYALTPSSPPAPAPATTLINNVFVTNDGAYFTNTLGPLNTYVFKIPIGPNGELPDPTDPSSVDRIPVPFTGGNGIVATPDGGTLIAVSSGLNKIYTIDAETGLTRQIALDVPPRAGDGIILEDHTLYVAEKLPAAAFPGVTEGDVAVYQLSDDFSSGTFVAYLNSDASDPLIDPTDADHYGAWIYTFQRGTTAPATPIFHITRIDAHQ
jgi:hypothetical protein